MNLDFFEYIEPNVTHRQVRDFNCRISTRDDVVGFIEYWHYSKDINGVISDYCFKLECDGDVIGAAIFGRLAMANQWKRFGDQEQDVIELRRLCCVDKTPKNTESYFIGAMLRWLKKFTKFKVVVSYADMEHNHTGTVYKASNFECLGEQVGAKVICWNEKQYHDKAIRTKYNGEMKPFAVDLKKAIENGEATYKKTAGKVAYIYKLQKIRKLCKPNK